MARVFPFLAAISSVLLLSSLATGFPTTNIHTQICSSSVATALALHAAVFLFLERSASRCATLVASHNFPDRIVAQAAKNRLRPYPFLCLSVILLGAAFSVAPADGSSSPIQSQLHLALASFATAFNLGSFLVEYLSIAAQERLLQEIRG